MSYSTNIGCGRRLKKIKDDVLVCGCGFLALNGDRVFPFTAEEATGEFSWRDQNLKTGVAVYKNSVKKAYVANQVPDVYVEYLPDAIILHERNANTGEEVVERQENPTGRPLMGLLTHRATTKRPFGQSVVSRPARDAILDASRTVRQAMIAARAYNVKVDVILGADVETAVDKVEGQVGDILKIGTNSNGQIPNIGEFAQHAMQPFSDTILTAARNFCSDTDLSLVNLGISTDAPQSTESLEIVNDDLRDDINNWQDELGVQLKYFAETLFMYDNGLSELDDNLQEKIRAIKPVFMPIFQQDVSKFGDGLSKLAQVVPEIVKARTIWQHAGLTSEEIDRVIASTQV